MPPGTSNSPNYDHLSDRKLVGIDGNWYDVTDFIDKHPGGEIIEHYIGKDASEVFHSWGHKNVLKHRKPISRYSKKIKHPADEEFRKLDNFFQENGFYDTNWSYYKRKIAVILVLWILSFILVECENQFLKYFSGVTLCAFWQQCGFMMHDLMHTQFFRNLKSDRIAGTIFGTIGFGISAHWWQDEHRLHHALVNTADPKNGFADPQMIEEVWAQHEKLFSFFNKPFQKFAISIQHYTFIPLVALAGRFAIIRDAYSCEKRSYEWFAIILHWSWIVLFLSRLDNWTDRFIVYGLASLLEGILHIQLVLSHYAKPWQYEDEYHANSWYVIQVESNLNISCPVWMDWFHGGKIFFSFTK